MRCRWRGRMLRPAVKARIRCLNAVCESWLFPLRVQLDEARARHPCSVVRIAELRANHGKTLSEERLRFRISFDGDVQVTEHVLGRHVVPAREAALLLLNGDHSLEVALRFGGFAVLTLCRREALQILRVDGAPLT